MILLVGLAFKLVKWAAITAMYLLIGVAKVVAIVVVLAYFGIRAGIRLLRRDRDGDEDVAYPYQGLHDLHLRSSSVSEDRFDPAWQRERDRRVAATQTARSTGRTVPSPGGDRVRP